jgi:transposase, IS30 family
MNTFHHLSLNERYQLEALLKQSTSIKAIAACLQRHADTIKREIARGCLADGRYDAQHAQTLSDTRKATSRNAKQIPSELWPQVEQLLALGLSPAQVSGRLESQFGLLISHETIYLYIYEQISLQGRVIAQLRCRHKKRKRRHAPQTAQRKQRGAIQNRVGIEQRPGVVDAKTRIGDWEGDTIVGRHHEGGLVTLVERKSLYTLACPVVTRRATLTSEAIQQMLIPHIQRCHTITLDNGSEFALHQEFGEALKADIFFADPHSPWQRGLNENTNGLYRQYFPKGCCMRWIEPKQVQYAVNCLNHRPRKSLGWRTPHEVFFDLPMSKLTL